MEWFERARAFEGDVGVWYRPLGGEVLAWNEDMPLVAASVIKLPILVEAFRQASVGALDPDMEIRLREADKMPSCGALNCLHAGLSVTVRDLLVLMIILSDNTATNLMIDRLSMEAVNGCMQRLGIPGICLRRRLFDAEASARGIQNTVTARGIGLLLERMAEHRLLGDPWDAEMLRILTEQRLNGKLPFFLHSLGVTVAHKTGEDDGITHDVGIIYGAKPFVLCMLSNNVRVPAFERLMQDAALECWQGAER